jgi:hypothetical protein
MATGARFSAAPDHPPRFLSPFSRRFLDKFTLEGLSGTDIRDLTRQVNQNRGAYTFDHQPYSVASVQNYVEPVKQTINSLRNRVPFKNDEPVADILYRNNIPLNDTLDGFARFQPQPSEGAGHLPSEPPPLGVPERLNLRYMNPNRLPPWTAENAAAGTRTYGGVTVHGGPDAWGAYQDVREFATQHGFEHDQGREIIVTLENSSEQTHVYPYKVQHGIAAENYPVAETMVSDGPQGRLVEVLLSNNQGMLAANGSRLPPAATGVHELQHAVEFEYGLGPAMGNYANLAEMRAINGAEGGALEARGIPRRDSHKSGTYYQTTGPTSVTAANPVVEEIQRAAIPELRRLTTRLVNYGVDQSRPPAWEDGEAGKAQLERDRFAYSVGKDIKRAEGRE